MKESFVIKNIKTQEHPIPGRMTVEEIQQAMFGFQGKTASCDTKYKEYVPVDVPKLNHIQFIKDLNDILNSAI